MTDVIDSFHGDNHWLSNFEHSPIVYLGRLYATVEHAYQAAKARTVEDLEYIRSSSTPGTAKARGRRVLMKEGWDDEKVAVMRELLERKFSIPEFRDRLIATGDTELIEGNWWGDTFWGVCEGVGRNELGILLMEIRKGMK